MHAAPIKICHYKSQQKLPIDLSVKRADKCKI